ncbi:MAG: HAD-IC family P-type ATPase [Proteobacteria bacterium]|nr:HAD-IC family P-type ATPase [Pseudomonadota bacterium]
MPPSAGVAGAGLTTAAAREALARVGPNEIAEARDNLLRRLLTKLWAPVPWMLEAAVLLELALGKRAEAAIIAALVLLNAVVALAQEGRARTALAALRSRLALNASVHRDGAWVTLPARELVPGDRVKLSLGAVVPADARLTAGEVLLDQSMLTGESVPVELGPGAGVYAGALVRRGEAEALVTATGERTRFGRTAELVRTAHVAGTQQKAVLHVVRNLALFNGVVILLLVLYAWHQGLGLGAIEPLVLTAVLASIPVSLPATFTMAAALSAHALAARGVLATRLSALDEAGSIDLLCSDKTGTLTRNTLRVVLAQPFAGFDESGLRALAALASSDGGADPVDAAIRAAAGPAADWPRRIAFEAFDPQTKRAEARVVDAQGREQRIMKGAFAAIADAVGADDAQRGAAEALEAQGHRVLAVAVQGAQGADAGRIAGLIALSDPPREDAAQIVGRLHEHGVRVLMVTGDAPATAAAVARMVGIEGPVCTAGGEMADVRPERCAVLAGVLPQDKFRLVQGLQAAGHTVGMCGDGANDAPALRQAHMGIAVAQATDVAKAAAGLVLTEPGLGGIMSAIEEGRRTFRRVQTYALNSIIKKVATVLFIAAGFVMTGQAILSPLLMIVLLVVGDLLSMAITTDRVTPSRLPNVWRIGALTAVGVSLGLAQLLFAIGVLAVGAFWLRLAPGALMTLAFLTLVFAGQATIYAIRIRGWPWETAPGGWLAAASLADLAIGAGVAMSGAISAPLPGGLMLGLLAASALLALLLSGLRRLAFVRLGLA